MTAPSLSDSPFSDCWFLTGPTATGKSDLAIELAERLNAEIIALDSMTVYRQMAIGVAKPTPEQQARVPHHLIDVLEPWQSATVRWYLDQAANIATAIRNRGKQPLFVGGTPLYLKACLRGLFDGPGADPELRRQWTDEAGRLGVGALHARLAAADPASAARIQPNDLRRIVRALEVLALTGRPISEHQTQFGQAANPPPKVACLVRSTEETNQRIHARVDAMLANGWIEEARQLLASDPPPSREALQAVGYKLIGQYLAGELTHDAMREQICIKTRQFRKHQMTWFRHLSEVVFFEVGVDEAHERRVERLARFFRPDA